MPPAYRNVNMQRYWVPGTNGGGHYEASPAFMQERSDVAASNRQRAEDIMRRHNRLVRGFGLAGGAIAGAGLAGAAGAFGSGAASAAPAASGSGFWGGVTAPTFGATVAPAATSAGASMIPVAASGAAGGAFTVGDILRLGTGIGTSALGARASSRALDRQLAAERYGIDQQMQFAREQEEFRRQEAARVAAEDQRRWEAEQAAREREWQLAMEDRERKRRLEDEDLARRDRGRATVRELMRFGPRYQRR